ncbi:MAG: hypothetical protein GF329_04350 [Candidatus Lokiarchaeota archaeon]|nr:hypothetical protein [Candidatus Lokiarchaeota archaeon]
MKELFKINRIYNGNNLSILKEFPENSVDLIYIDPPFFTNKNHKVILEGDDEIRDIRSFNDKWAGGIQEYISWMRPRIEEIKRVLKKTGTFYLHCDYHSNAYLRVMLDQIFGANKFRNEIIWGYAGGGIPKKDFPRKHDTIFRYVKGDDWTFNTEYRPYGDWTKNHEPRHSLTSGGKKLDMKKGTPINDWWIDFTRLTSYHKEWLGYPTQKPEALLERIINISSNEGDIVMDAFCGSGTTLAVSKRLKRHFIGIDISIKACKISTKRIDYPISEIIKI